MEVAKETPTISKLEKSVRSHVLPELDNQTDRVRQKNYYYPTLTNDTFQYCKFLSFYGELYQEHFGEFF